MQVSATSLGSTPADPGENDLETAANLGILSSTPITVNDFLGDFNGLYQDYGDYFKFELAENSLVNLQITGASDRVLLRIYDSQGIQKANVLDTNITLEQNFLPGSYYAQIVPYIGNPQNYTLQATATSLGSTPADPGDSSKFRYSRHYACHSQRLFGRFQRTLL